MQGHELQRVALEETAATKVELPSEMGYDEDREMRERGSPDGEEERDHDRVTRSDSSSSWSCADDTVHSTLDNLRDSPDDGLVMRPIGETIGKGSSTLNRV